MASIKEQRSARRWGIFFKGAFLAYFLVILFLAWPTGGKKFEHHAPHAAMVTVNGMISAADEANAKSISEGLRNAFEAEKSKGVIVKINSPGGSPVQSSYIYNEMRRLRAKYPEKKLYAVIEDLGGSGGYFVAVGADEIYADPASIVGSIGVLMPNFGFVEIMQKIGVEQRTLAAGENKNFLDPLSPVKPEQVAFMKNCYIKKIT